MEKEMREKLVATVSRLVNDRGSTGFTVDDVAHKLGISKKTIYKYAASKEELVADYLRASLDDNLAQTEAAIAAAEGTSAKLEAALRTYNRFRIPSAILEGIRRSYPDCWELIEEQRRVKLGLVRRLLSEGVAAGELRADIDQDFLVLLLDRFTAAIIEGSLLAARNLGVNEAIAEIKKILLGGIFAAEAPRPGSEARASPADSTKDTQ